MWPFQGRDVSWKGPEMQEGYVLVWYLRRKCLCCRRQQPLKNRRKLVKSWITFIKFFPKIGTLPSSLLIFQRFKRKKSGKIRQYFDYSSRYSFKKIALVAKRGLVIGANRAQVCELAQGQIRGYGKILQHCEWQDVQINVRIWCWEDGYITRSR